MALTEADSKETVVAQWRQLWLAHGAEDTVLLAHFWNHYAMIYAMREWTDAPTGESHREFLTAKPAQRPCRWISWAEMRGFLLQWHGYCIMRFDALAPEAAPAPMTASSPTLCRIAPPDAVLAAPQAVD